MLLGGGEVHAGQVVGDGSANPQVFDLGPTDLDVSTQELNLRDIPLGAAVLVNVGGAAPVVGMVRINADVTGAPTLFNVLFNLHQATAAAIPTEVNGSVLIPGGGLTLGGSLNGRLLVGGDVTFSGSGQELHNYPFTGELPSCAATPTAPIPSSACRDSASTASAARAPATVPTSRAISRAAPASASPSRPPRPPHRAPA